MVDGLEFKLSGSWRASSRTTLKERCACPSEDLYSQLQKAARKGRESNNKTTKRQTDADVARRGFLQVERIAAQLGKGVREDSCQRGLRPKNVVSFRPTVLIDS